MLLHFNDHRQYFRSLHMPNRALTCMIKYNIAENVGQSLVYLTKLAYIYIIYLYLFISGLIVF